MIPNCNFLLLPIKKPYSKLIIAGEKRFELRRRIPKIDCKYVLIYETRPTKAIIGIFEVRRKLIDSVDNIWRITKEYSCVSKEFFQKYYKGKNVGVAFEIKNVKELDTPISLSSLGIEHAPQDFMYVRSQELERLITI